MPNGLVIRGREYPISTDFRTAVAYQRAAAEGSLTAEQFLDLWFPVERPEDVEAALEAVGAFYTMGQKGPERNTYGPAPYDLQQDAGAIYAAFYREYGLDLGTASLHWWQFRALLEGLITHSFQQRVGYRVGDLGGLDAKERAQALKLRRLYAIEGESLQAHLERLERLAQKTGKEAAAWTAAS